MKISNFSDEFNDVKVVDGIYFNDERGSLKKVMYGDKLKSLIDPICEVIISTSKKNVIRGLHFQNPPHDISKLVTCVKGEIVDCFLDIRRNSKNYGKFETISLKHDDKKAVLIPKGFAHGFSVISDEAMVVYLQSGDFNEEHDTAINPISLGIDWKVKNYILSDKDKDAIPFKEFDSLF